MFGKMGKRISQSYSVFKSRISELFGKIGTKTAEKTGIKSGVKNTAKSNLKAAAKGATETLSKSQAAALSKAAAKSAKELGLKEAQKLLPKLGFVTGRTYKYTTKAGKAAVITIKEISDNGIQVIFKGSKTATSIPFDTFIKQAVVVPWMRRGSGIMVPLFIKRFAAFINGQGTLDWLLINQTKDLDPSITEGETYEFIDGEVADYQGDDESYEVNDTVILFQKALKALGYDIGSMGVDGKFGPKTRNGLMSFQRESNMGADDMGKMTVKTANLMAYKISQTNGESDPIASELRKLGTP
jgi:peptidoglycan hydrolase-like protein with peptidoglycan-binding domain